MTQPIHIDTCIERIVEGELIDFDTALQLVQKTTPDLLFQKADQLRQKFHKNNFDLCAIINGKSGRCSEDCRFCAQSSHYDVTIDEYELVTEDELLRQAVDNQNHGVKRFSIVTAGKELTLEQLESFRELFKLVQEKTSLRCCASMGMLTKEKAEKLYSHGVNRYHCNLETSRSNFENICTTHTWQEKVDTILHARAAGMDICSGGIFGVGETLEQRLELAFELRQLEVLSIPINVLVPIKNTPLEDIKPLTVEEVLQGIAIFRLINPKAVIRLAGGRNQFGQEQYRCFESGANGAIVGNYLTTKGNELAEDLYTIKKHGFTF